MKSALVYLLLTRLKAQFKEMVRKPARLIYLVLVIALFAITLLGGGEAGGAARDARELPALAGAVYGLMFVILVSAGFKNGASMFTLSDVNLLFPAPIRPRAVLYYGLFRQLGASLLLGLFLLFQYGWLHSLYGVGVGILILIVVLYGVSVFLAQVVAMAAYSLTSMSPRRRALGFALQNHRHSFHPPRFCHHYNSFRAEVQKKKGFAALCEALLCRSGRVSPCPRWPRASGSSSPWC